MNVIPKLNGPVALSAGTCKAMEPKTARDPSLPAEGYVLEVGPEGITLTAADDAGEFYGRQTLAQMGDDIPCGRYEDAPKYSFRSYMLDVSRHFFDAQEVKKLLDQMARLKLNVFHWHLSDDQGFRIESRKFPKLNEVGSWREEDGKKVGGFYTQDEIRDIVDYAAARHITIVPEIDLPGHTIDIVATFPALSCSGEPLDVAFGSGIYPRILCAGNDQVYDFLYQLLGEVCDLFPGPYFHIGGDEAPKSEWEKCPRCQRKIQEQGLKDEEDLQAWFTGKLIEFLESRGKTVIGWNEILTSGTVSPKAIAQYWIESGADYSDKEADKGRRFVFANCSRFYLDYPEALVTMRGLYEYEPFIVEGKAIPKEQVLGLEAPLWTERIADNQHVERLTFPRLMALAENCWTVEKDYAGFLPRVEAYNQRLQDQGVACTPVSACELQGEARAIAAVHQVAEVAYGFTTAVKDPAERGKKMRDICSGMAKGFLDRGGYSDAEKSAALAAIDEAVNGSLER